MGVEDNKRIVRELIERMAEGDSSVIDELTAEDFVLHGSTGERDKENLKQTNDGGHIAYSDYSMTIEDIVAEGDKVIVRLTRRGTHTGDFYNLPPTGKRIEVTRFMVVGLSDGKIKEAWVLEDQMSHFQQLGVLPSLIEIFNNYIQSH